MRVLAVTSSSFFRHLLQSHLSFLPSAPQFAGSLAEATQHVVAGGVDLICLDRHYPDGTALDLARFVRSQPASAQTPLLLLTSAADDADIVAESLAAGITEIFDKCDPEALADHIEQRLQRDSGEVRLEGRVLLVEDSAPVVGFICDVLEPLGLEVDIHHSAESALVALASQPYEIALIDVLLSGQMTGLALVRHIRRQEPPLAQLPILAMSALEDVRRRMELLHEGANDFLAKPMHAEELAVRVRNIVLIRRLLDETAGQRDQLRRLALTDQLTGVHNRHYLTRTAPRRLSEATRHGLPITLLAIDIDHFKRINDEHGHETGDLVLAETAAAIRSVCRQGDIIARTGGEEFVLMLLNMNRQVAIQFAERLRRHIELSCPGELALTISIGVITSEGEAAMGFEEMFRRADEALYEAKKAGRNRVVHATL